MGIIKGHFLEEYMLQKKRILAGLKLQIVLVALREDKSMAQIALEKRIHPNRIY